MLTRSHRAPSLARNASARAKHGFMNPMRFFADDDCVCGACGSNFRTRLRLLHHFSDARRAHCRDECNGGTVTKLSKERVEWAFARDCTVASLEFEWTCSRYVDLLRVNHACLDTWNRFL